MSIPISTIVNVTVAIPPSFPSGTGFSTLMVLGTSPNLPLGTRAKAFASVQAVGQQFAASSEEYKASLSFFSQNPRPPFMVIGRQVTGPTGGELLGSGNYESNIARWKALGPAEQLQLTIDGVPLIAANMDFSQVANLNGVAEAVQQALLIPIRGSGTLIDAMEEDDTEVPLVSASVATAGDTLRIDDEFMTVTSAADPRTLVVTRGARNSTPTAHAPGRFVYILVSGVMNSTFLYTGKEFFCRSGSVGPTSTVAVTNATTLSDMLGFDDHAISTPGITDEEDIAEALDACQTVVTFYGLVLTRDFTDADALEAATWAEANTKLFGHASGDQAMRAANSTTDFGAAAQAKAYSRTASAYNDPQGLSDYLMVSALARELSVDFSQPNSTITMKFKQCPGVTASNIDSDDKYVLDAKNANYYAVFGQTPMFATGVMANAGWIDQRHGLDFLSRHLANAAFSGLLSAPKVPQNERGMAYITGLLEVAMEDMVRCGLIAPGTWRGTGISGVVNTGEFLDKGYKIVAGRIADQSEADRQARKAPPITIACKGAGAIHSVDVFVQFEQ